MLVPVLGYGCQRVSLRNTRGQFKSAAAFARGRAARCFRYSCPRRLRRWLQPDIGSLFFMKKLTVMVVDDEPLVADTILEILKEDGIDGYAFSSGQTALNWFS